MKKNPIELILVDPSLFSALELHTQRVPSLETASTLSHDPVERLQHAHPFAIAPGNTRL